MYNGVGLTSVRGSATNGYVQRNLAHQKPKTKIDYNKEMEKAMAKPSLGPSSVPRPCTRTRAARGRESARPLTAGHRSLLVTVCAPALAGPVRLVVVSRTGPCALPPHHP
jgi:hypothetical protein